MLTQLAFTGFLQADWFKVASISGVEREELTSGSDRTYLSQLHRLHTRTNNEVAEVNSVQLSAK